MTDLLIHPSALAAIEHVNRWKRARAMKRATMRPGYRAPTADDWRLLQDEAPPRRDGREPGAGDGPEAA